jgi:hypothetical protein
MAVEDVLRDLKRFELRPGATPKKIEALKKWARGKLPESYLDFLKFSNGGEGFVGKYAYLLLYPAEDIPKLVKAAGVDRFAPGLILIGSDGGDTVYAFDTNQESTPIVAASAECLSLDNTKTIGSDFEEFLTYLINLKDD